MPSAVRARVAVEAAATFGWHKYVGLDGAVIGLDHFGASAPYKVLFKEFGFTAENVAAPPPRRCWVSNFPLQACVAFVAHASLQFGGRFPWKTIRIPKPCLSPRAFAPIAARQ